jgi:hypothetical protein
MEMATSIHPAFATGVLNPETHARFVADITSIAQDAAITPEWLWRPLADSVSGDEVTWVKRFKMHSREGVAGLCLTGKAPNVEDRLSAIAGALVRNFIRARVFTVGHLFDLNEAGAIPDPTCLVIPNFFLGKAGGTSIPAWKVSVLHDVLVERQMKGRQTVLYVSDMKALAAEYGSATAQFIASRYELVDIG